MRVSVGDIVLLPFLNFKQETVTGLFLVIYHEASDGNKSSGDFTAIKVSSHEYFYGIPLLKKFLPFLAKDCWVNCNQQYRFQETSVKNIIGRINNPSMFNIMQQVIKYQESTIRQMDQSLAGYRPRPKYQ